MRVVLETRLDRRRRGGDRGRRRRGRARLRLARPGPRPAGPARAARRPRGRPADRAAAAVHAGRRLRRGHRVPRRRPRACGGVRRDRRLDRHLRLELRRVPRPPGVRRPPGGRADARVLRERPHRGHGSRHGRRRDRARDRAGGGAPPRLHQQHRRARTRDGLRDRPRHRRDQHVRRLLQQRRRRRYRLGRVRRAAGRDRQEGPRPRHRLGQRGGQRRAQPLVGHARRSRRGPRARLRRRGRGQQLPRRRWPHDVCLRPLARVGAGRLQRLRPLRDLGGRHGRGGRRGGSAGLESDRGGVLHEQRADAALLGGARPPGRRRIAPHRPLRPGWSRPRARRAQGQPARAGGVAVRPVGRRRLRAQRRRPALQRPRSRHRPAEAGSRGPGRGLEHDGGDERRVLVGLHRHVGGGASRRGVDRSAAGAVPRQLGVAARGARARLGARRRRPGPRPRHRLRRRAPGHRGSRGRRVDGVPARGRRRARQRARDVLGPGHGLLAVRPVGRLRQPDGPAAVRELPGRRGRRRRAPVRPGRDLPRAHRRHERLRHHLRP